MAVSPNFGQGRPIATERISVAEYLEREFCAQDRSEYENGQIIAMSGASLEHNRIVSNLTGELYLRLKGTSCQAFTADQRVWLPSTHAYCYPDVVTVCSEPSLNDDRPQALLNPIAIFELLSESTEERDRGVKFEGYRQIPSLQEYVLIAQEKPQAAHYIRKSENRWLVEYLSGLETQLILESLNVSLRLTDLFDRITFPPETPNAAENEVRRDSLEEQ